MYIKMGNLKISLLVSLFLFITTSTFAATYYISPAGSDSSGSGTFGSSWATLSTAFSNMTGGDTLIVKDGLYIGADNHINNNSHPPRGSTGAWTTIKAEHDGAVIFSGLGDGLFFILPGNTLNLYWQFEGILWCNTGGDNIYLGKSAYVKFLRCGAYDSGNGNNSNFTVGAGCDYILFENCYAYGNGRYKFNMYKSNHIILRQCVGRLDRDDAQGEPIAVFSVYSCSDVEVQNCIAIDTDQTGKYLNVEVWGGPFIVPSTNLDSYRINFNRCIGINIKLGGLNTTGNEYHMCHNVTFKDCVLWDVSLTGVGAYLYNLKGLNDTIMNCTFGINTSDTRIFSSYNSIGYSNNTVFKNNVVYKATGTPILFDNIETEDYNDLYQNQGRGKGAHDKTLNPIWNVSSNPKGALKYIVKVETASNLSGKGEEEGADIGANALKMIGKTGTLWGEPGYNVEQNMDMWPFPNEDLIRTKMKAYNAGGVSGNRGFCADGTTLTKYIWEYLGNTIPPEIYGKNK